MTAYTFSVNVVVQHPRRPAADIAAGLEWQPYNSWSSGETRMTPAGTPLPGTRLDTMCAFRSEHESAEVTPVVVQTVEHLLSRRSFIQDLLDSGGTLALNVGLNGQLNSNLNLTAETLRTIADLGMTLSVECFPDG